MSVYYGTRGAPSLQKGRLKPTGTVECGQEAVQKKEVATLIGATLL